ncbi:MAG: toll/interleukin-1 receptor domain-containing protein [Pirellulales bacterium]
MQPNSLPNLIYGVRKVNAFVGHSFAEEDSRVVERICDFLERLGIKCESGLRPEPSSITEKVKRRILEAEIFVGIITKRAKNFTSAWVVEEKTFALTEKKPMLLFVEDGVTEFGGMQQDLEYIPFSRENLGDALVRAIDYVLAISSVPLESVFIPPNRFHINIKVSANAKSIDELKREKERATANVDVRIELVKQYRTKGYHSEAKRELELATVEFPKNSSLMHELAHSFEQFNDIDQALSKFQIALDLDSKNPKNYRCFANALSRKSTLVLDLVEKRALLERAKRFMTQAAAIGDDNFKRQVDLDLFPIEEKLRSLEKAENQG